MTGGRGDIRGQERGRWVGAWGAAPASSAQETLPATPWLLPELLQLPPSCNQSLPVASEAGRRPRVNRAALGGPGAPQPPSRSPSLVLCLGTTAEAPSLAWALVCPQDI